MSTTTKTKFSRIRKADPFLEREKQRYDHPLPSREYVTQTLETQGVPLGFETLCQLLDITDKERDSFERRLGAMQREGELLKNRKGDFILPERASLIAGRIQGHPDGFGFLIPDDGGPDVFLEQRQMERALHGDRALV
ncbi:MAG: ribonuclease R, partial [Azovibrio sp.]